MAVSLGDDLGKLAVYNRGEESGQQNELRLNLGQEVVSYGSGKCGSREQGRKRRVDRDSQDLEI